MHKIILPVCFAAIICFLMPVSNVFARNQFTPTTSAGPRDGWVRQSSQGSNSSSSTPTYDPVAEQRKEGRNINEQGVTYYNAGNWAKAVEYFEDALKKWPDNQIMQENLSNAKYKLNEEIARKERAQKDAESAENMRRTLLKSADEYSAPATSGASGYGKSNSSGLAFMSPGSPANSGKLKAKGAGNAVDQANTIYIDTRKGLKGNAESSKTEAGKTFDDPVRIIKVEVKPVVDLSGMGERPQWPDIVKKDKEIVKLQKVQDALNALHAKKDNELTRIRKEMESASPARKSELAVTAVKVKTDLSKAEYDIAIKEKEIRRRAKMIIDTRVE
jgi:hypothetical protein